MNKLNKSDFENRTIQKYLIVQQEGKRNVKREVEHYNLDVIVSVGYRVNSKKATKFRQWATFVLKSYIQNGYAINSEKITHQRFKELKDNFLKPSKGIFFGRQTYNLNCRKICDSSQ